MPLWKSIPIERARIAARTVSDRRDTRSPATSTTPPSGSSSPAMHASSVDFPEPDGPMTATSSPGSAVSGDSAQRERLLVARVVEAVEVAGVEDARHRHRNDVVTVRQGSTLSDPCGACNVTTARRPAFQNS